MNFVTDLSQISIAQIDLKGFLICLRPWNLYQIFENANSYGKNPVQISWSETNLKIL